MQIKTVGRDREQHHKQRRENAYILAYVHREIGEYEQKLSIRPHTLANPTGGSGKESRTKWKEILYNGYIGKSF